MSQQLLVESLFERDIEKVIENSDKGSLASLGLALDMILNTKDFEVMKALLKPSILMIKLMKLFDLYLDYERGIKFVNIVLKEGMPAAQRYIGDSFIEVYKARKYHVEDTVQYVNAFMKDVEELMGGTEKDKEE